MPPTASLERAAPSDPLLGETAWASYGVLVTAAFVLAALVGVGPRPFTMAGAAGAAALAASSSREVTLASVVALGAIPIAVAAALGGGRGRELALAMLVLAAASWDSKRWRVAVAAAGAAAFAAAVLVGHAHDVRPDYAVDPGTSAVAALLFAIASVALLISAMSPPRPHPLVVLLVPAIVAGLAAAAGTAVESRLALCVAGVTAVVAVAFDRPAAALAALSVAASVALDAPAVVLLLAVAAVIVAAWPPRPLPASAIVAVPGLAGLAAAVAANPTRFALALGAFAAVCAGAAATRFDVRAWRTAITPATAPAALLAAWATLAPQSWGWLGPLPPPVRTSARSLTAAVALGALALVLGALAGRRTARTTGHSLTAPR